MRPLRPALTFAFFEAAMPLVGLFIGRFVGARFETPAGVLGGVILLAVASYMMKEALENEEGDDLSFSSLRAATLAGFGISMDELAIGFPMGTSGLPIAETIGAIAVQAVMVTYVGVVTGTRLGETLGRRTSRAAGLMAAAAFALLGIYLIAQPGGFYSTRPQFWAMLRGLWSLFLVLGVALGAAPAVAAPAVVLATTTSTQDTGLLDVLVPAFEKASGYHIKTIAVGTGAALAMGERGDADVLLVHAPAAEEAYMAKDRGLSRALVMHNAFIVVGPASDPAHIKGMTTAQEAFAAIARGQAPFVSRADDSGTNIKELALWKAASATPAGAWYIKTGSGMADSLHVASQKAAYTLTDDGTYLSQRATISLVPLVDDAKDLRNVYHVIVVKPFAGRVSNEPGGDAFAKFVTSLEGQRIIATYGRERFGRPLFTPDAGKGP